MSTTKENGIPEGYAQRNYEESGAITYVGYNFLHATAAEETWAIKKIDTSAGTMRWAYRVSWNDRATANYYW